jgi:hypothetical protein
MINGHRTADINLFQIHRREAFDVFGVFDIVINPRRGVSADG